MVLDFGLNKVTLDGKPCGSPEDHAKFGGLFFNLCKALTDEFIHNAWDTEREVMAHWLTDMLLELLRVNHTIIPTDQRSSRLAIAGSSSILP